MHLIFIPPHLPPALNGDKGLLRMHWSKRTKVKEKFQWEIKLQTKIKYEGAVTATLINYYARVPMDWDNLASRFKIVGDALVANKQIVDDNPKYVVDFQMRQQKVATVREARLEVLIEPFSELN